MSKKLFSQLNDWMNQISMTMNEKIRENLYNIEQYRADAHIVQETKVKTNDKGGKISNSTKTSGTTNLVAGNSMTGKNPFAILKASAIASPTSAVFPNNFTNLPKVIKIILKKTCVFYSL